MHRPLIAHPGTPHDFCLTPYPGNGRRHADAAHHPEATMNTIQGTSLEANSPTVAPSAITPPPYSAICSTRTNPAEAIR